MDFREHSINEITNDSSAAILSMVPPIYRKYLIIPKRNSTNSSGNGTTQINLRDQIQAHNFDEIRRNIVRYNELQSVLNEDLFGPLQNDSVIIVVQVSLLFVFSIILIV